MYQVFSVVQRCFRFLLHTHKRRDRSSHLCVVTELAHRLGYENHHQECLDVLRRKAHKVFRNASALAQLCQKCMLSLVVSEDLAAVSEIVVNQAVVMWALNACERDKVAPSLEALRGAAGDLVYHVRYLAMPRMTLMSLNTSRSRPHPSCLLTTSEMAALLNGDVPSHFPSHVSCKRRRKRGLLWFGFDSKSREERVTVCLCLAFLVFIFLFTVLFPLRILLASN